MKMFFSASSPFVRKVAVTAAELGLTIEHLPSAAHPISRDARIVAQNPLGQVPTLIAEDGTVLYDSAVICEYLDASAGGGRIVPAVGPARWQALVEQTLGDGLLNAAILIRYELTARPEEKRWSGWQEGQMAKIHSALDALEARAAALEDRVDIGTITIGCALGYLDFRFGDMGWREGRPALAAWQERFDARPSMQATRPAG